MASNEWNNPALGTLILAISRLNYCNALTITTFKNYLETALSSKYSSWNWLMAYVLLIVFFFHFFKIWIYVLLIVKQRQWLWPISKQGSKWMYAFNTPITWDLIKTVFNSMILPACTYKRTFLLIGPSLEEAKLSFEKQKCRCLNLNAYYLCPSPMRQSQELYILCRRTITWEEYWLSLLLTTNKKKAESFFVHKGQPKHSQDESTKLNFFQSEKNTFLPQMSQSSF